MKRKEKRLIFVSGGARSGKSTFVENWAKKNGNNILFIATAERIDEEMDQRINDHINNRPKSWDTLEKPLNISESFSDNFKKYDTIILDCINLLSSNAGALADKLASGISPVNLVPSNLPAAKILFAKLLVILPILSYFGKILIVISAEAAGAVTKVKVVPEIV